VERVVILQPEAAGLAVTVHLSYEEPFPDRTDSWGSLGVERQDENQRFVSVVAPVLQGDGGRARAWGGRGAFSPAHGGQVSPFAERALPLPAHVPPWRRGDHRAVRRRRRGGDGRARRCASRAVFGRSPSRCRESIALSQDAPSSRTTLGEAVRRAHGRAARSTDGLSFRVSLGPAGGAKPTTRVDSSSCCPARNARCVCPCVSKRCAGDGPKRRK
jgi:hypothetical protein